jgi:nitrate/nitrite transporter NarK
MHAPLSACGDRGVETRIGVNKRVEVISVHIWRLISLVVCLLFLFSVLGVRVCQSTWGLTQQDIQIVKAVNRLFTASLSQSISRFLIL